MREFQTWNRGAHFTKLHFSPRTAKKTTAWRFTTTNCSGGKRFLLTGRFKSGAQSLGLASKPLDTVTKPPETAIKPPNTATNPTELSLPSISHSSEVNEPSAVLFDPEIQANSWSPSQAFHSFLEKQFRRKHSYE